MPGLGTLVANLTIDNAGWKSGFQSSRGALGSFMTATGGTIRSAGNSASKVIDSLGKSGPGILKATGSAISDVIKATGQAASGYGKMGTAALKAANDTRLSMARAATETQKQAMLLERINNLKLKHKEFNLKLKEFNLKVDAQDLRREMFELRKGLSQDRMLGGLYTRAAGAVMGGGQRALSLAAEAEQNQIKFDVMLGGADKARAMLSDLRAYAKQNPVLGVEGANEAASMLMQYGVQAQDVIPTISALGDISAGNSEKFQSLSIAMGQVTANGRLMGQELLQFVNAGFNPLQEISQKTGQSMAELKKQMEQGGVSAKMVADAIASATSEGGRFAGMTERQTTTIAGKWATTKSNVDDALRGIGESLVTYLDLSGWLEYLNTALREVPMFFRNSGSLIEVAILDWQLYFHDLIPGFSGVMEVISSVMIATWDGSKAALSSFLDQAKSLWTNFKGFLMAIWDGIKAGMESVLSGKGVFSAAETAQKAFQESLGKAKSANPDVLAPGKAFANQFAETYKNAREGFQQPGMGLTDQLKIRKDELLKSVGDKEWKLTVEAPKLPEAPKGASFNDSVTSEIVTPQDTSNESKKSRISQERMLELKGVDSRSMEAFARIRNAMMPDGSSLSPQAQMAKNTGNMVAIQKETLVAVNELSDAIKNKKPLQVAPSLKGGRA